MELYQSEQFHMGIETHAYTYFGCHRGSKQGAITFRVWAPHAKSVALTGEYCNWNPKGITMQCIGNGVFEVSTCEVPENSRYKYAIEDNTGCIHWKADPYAIVHSVYPDTSSVAVIDKPYPWRDGPYWKAHAKRKYDVRAVNIYELQLGNWLRDDNGGYLRYDEIADSLVAYCLKMHYTHIELMPICEYTNEASRGYQITGYFAPTNRYGTPDQLKSLIDTCHRANIGVIMDWVAGDFPPDEHALACFDGSCCYEIDDKSHNVRPEWNTLVFDLGRPEVRSFLLSNAVYWIEEYHLDGIRVAAVDSIIYWDYGGTEYKVKESGNNVNETALTFLNLLNSSVAAQHKNILTIAEESSGFPKITKPLEIGGLGFSFHWNNDWTGSVIRCIETDPFFRHYCQDAIADTLSKGENGSMVLPLSHNDVVQNRCTLIERCPGNQYDKFANMRLLHGLQIACPGKKLSFMGNEIGQFESWEELSQIRWGVLENEYHYRLQQWHADLNLFYVEHKQLWIDGENIDKYPVLCCDDRESSVIAIRRSAPKNRDIIAIVNMTPIIRDRYRIGVSKKGYYLPAISSDAPKYGGTGVAVFPTRAEPIPFDGFEYSAQFTLPPLSVVFYIQE